MIADCPPPAPPIDAIIQQLIAAGDLLVDPAAGRVYRRRHGGPGHARYPTPKLLYPSYPHRGSQGRVTVVWEGRVYSVALARIIWVGAYGPLPANRRVGFRDGNPRNPVLSNLRLEAVSTAAGAPPAKDSPPLDR